MLTRTGLRAAANALVAAAILTATVLAAPPAGASPRPRTNPTALQQALQQLVADGVPGTMALVRQATTTQRAAAGVANLATGEPMSPYDRFRIGSITKSFVSTVVLQLAAEGRLSLDDAVEKWLPGVLDTNGYDGSTITIRELLNHTSGIANYTDLNLFLQVLHDPLRSYTPLELVDYAITNYPPLFPPGASFAYSNTDYILLGLIVAAVDHANVPPVQSLIPPAEVLARIVAPLGLLNTSWPVNDPDVHGLHTHGYEINAPAILDLPPVYDTTVENMSWAWSAGAVISTLDDVAKFNRALFTGQLLPAPQQQELIDFVPVGPGLDYGAGVFRLQTPCGPAYGHDGDTPAGYGISLFAPDGSRQLVMFANQDQNSFTVQESNDFFNTALITGFCGQQVTAATTHSFSTARHALANLSDAG
jgi:D-alanyl-D-alanine carboxypeptidase